MCDDRKRDIDPGDFKQELLQRASGATAKASTLGGPYPPESPYGGQSLGADNVCLSPATPTAGPTRSRDSYAREAVIQKRLHYKLEAQHALTNEIRELRRALDLSRQYDIAALTEYLELIQKHGL